LREARLKAGMSVSDVAERFGVEEPTIRNAERGRGTKVFAEVGKVFPDIAEEVDRAWKDYKQATAGSAEYLSDPVFGGRKATRSIEGQWTALWQTSVEGSANFNTETVNTSWTKSRSPVLVATNEAVSKENPKGGYLWRGELRFFDNCYLAGIYLPLEAKTTISKGTMFASIHRSGRFIQGIWAGCNYDEDLTSGHFIFSRSDNDVWELMSKLIDVPLDEFRKQ
jgi:transcriptional regulator with XRE-family HTH domain